MTEVEFDSAAFRRALGRFATGVAIITTGGENPVGMTCNSFSSVSLDPPLVQWSIARASRNFELMRAAKHFAVHVLDSSQQQLCTICRYCVIVTRASNAKSMRGTRREIT